MELKSQAPHAVVLVDNDHNNDTDLLFSQPISCPVRVRCRSDRAVQLCLGVLCCSMRRVLSNLLRPPFFREKVLHFRSREPPPRRAVPPPVVGSPLPLKIPYQLLESSAAVVGAAPARISTKSFSKTATEFGPHSQPRFSSLANIRSLKPHSFTSFTARRCEEAAAAPASAASDRANGSSQ